MAKVTLTPTPHHVWNEFDRHGLLLGLERLKEERNPEYKQRLIDVMIHRADSTYMGLIYGITRELGLSITDALAVTPVKDAEGVPLLPAPGIIFEHTKCYLYSDYSQGDLLLTIDRWETDGGAFTIQELADTINATGYFTATLPGDTPGHKRSMQIFNQRSVVLEAGEDLTGRGGKIKLDGQRLLPGTVSLRSPNLYRRVNSEVEIRRPGDYMIYLEDGILVASVAPAPGSTIRYAWRNDDFVAQASPVIIHNLQSDDFRTKMFDQVLGPDGDYANGLPTKLGADIINELLSVYPSNWGR